MSVVVVKGDLCGNGVMQASLREERVSGIELDGELSQEASLDGTLTLPKTVDMPPYEGEYTITPTDLTQILETSGLRMTDDIVINPIPNNYGLVSWNGSWLTIS